MSRQRVSEAHVTQLAGQLSSRDLAVVATLDRVRVATSEQLKRLHFSGGTTLANTRQAQRRLRALVELRVLATLGRRVGGPDGGSTQPVYALDVAGQRLASACGPAGGLRLRRPWTPGAGFLAHALAVTELYVRLCEPTRGGGELAAFDAEPACWRAFSGVGGGRTWLKPDAFVRFARGDFERFSFVEVDRATHSGPSVARKLTLYRRYWQTGREQNRWGGVFPKVVVLVPSEARRTALSEVASAQPAESWALFQIARYGDAPAVFTGGQP